MLGFKLIPISNLKIWGNDGMEKIDLVTPPLVKGYYSEITPKGGN